MAPEPASAVPRPAPCRPAAGAIALLAAVVAFPSTAAASNPPGTTGLRVVSRRPPPRRPRAIEPPDAAETRAVRYAALGGARCLDVLRRRDVPWEDAAPTRGVDTPVRLTGPLRGVRFSPVEALLPGGRNDHTIADCRLMLALDDLARILHRISVVEASYYSIYRRRGVGTVAPGKRHQGARAIDFVGVTLANGARYAVRPDFRRWTGTCEKAAPETGPAGARFWRALVCELAERRSFNLVLTPNYDWAHRDHLHLEVRSGIRWFLIR